MNKRTDTILGAVIIAISALLYFVPISTDYHRGTEDAMYTNIYIYQLDNLKFHPIALITLALSSLLFRNTLWLSKVIGGLLIVVGIISLVYLIEGFNSPGDFLLLSGGQVLWTLSSPISIFLGVRIMKTPPKTRKANNSL